MQQIPRTECAGPAGKGRYLAVNENREEEPSPAAGLEQPKTEDLPLRFVIPQGFVPVLLTCDTQCPLRHEFLGRMAGR
jgi:hypothetical protein